MSHLVIKNGLQFFCEGPLIMLTTSLHDQIVFLLLNYILDNVLLTHETID
jgi:hypothetical protein